MLCMLHWELEKHAANEGICRIHILSVSRSSTIQIEPSAYIPEQVYCATQSAFIILMKASIMLIFISTMKFMVSIGIPISALPSPCMSQAAIDNIFDHMYSEHKLGRSTTGKCFSGLERTRLSTQFGCKLGGVLCDKCVTVTDVKNALTECKNLVRNHQPRRQN